MHYHERNLSNLQKLADNTKVAAMKWYKYCVDNGIEILIYETIRSKEKQSENVRKGVSQTMHSYHIVGQALDFVPAQGNRTDWNDYGRADIKQAIAYAKQLGFEWGGDWRGFVDQPHLQFNYSGYGTDTFGKVSVKNIEMEMDKLEKDINKLADWAQESAKWALEIGLSDMQRPAADAERQEVVTMLHRFYEITNKQMMQSFAEIKERLSNLEKQVTELKK